MVFVILKTTLFKNIMSTLLNLLNVFWIGSIHNVTLMWIPTEIVVTLLSKLFICRILFPRCEQKLQCHVRGIIIIIIIVGFWLFDEVGWIYDKCIHIIIMYEHYAYNLCSLCRKFEFVTTMREHPRSFSFACAMFIKGGQRQIFKLSSKMKF